MKKYLVAIFIGVVMFGISAKSMAAAPASDVVCNGCVGTTDIANSAVTEAKVGTSAVTNAKIANGAVTDAKITGPISVSKVEKPANVITVAQSGGDFTSIGEALDSLPTPNITPVLIKVMPGTYQESFWTVMKSNVTLQGAGRDVTTIEGSIYIDSKTNITISGFTISTDPGNPMAAAIWTDNYLNLPDLKITISGNYISGGDYAGLVITKCSPYVTISDNIIAGNINGLRLDGCLGAAIRNNTITGNSGSGIYIANASPRVTGNTIANNATDITITSGSANISHNVFDIVSGTVTGSYNVKSDGTAW